MNKRTPIFETDEADALVEAVGVMKILSNPHRLAILCHLGEEELSVNEIADIVGLSQSALSQHLTRLKEASLVTSRRDHNKIYYSLSCTKAEKIISLLRELYCRDTLKNC